MATVFISRFFWTIKELDIAKRFRNAAIGILLVPLIQIVVAPLQLALDIRGVDLPASILVMTWLAIIMFLMNRIHRGVGKFYLNHLKEPTDFLGRHMSFGFVASFVMLNRDHITTAIDVPRIAAAFIVTTLIGYVSSFIFATGIRKVEERVRDLGIEANDVETPEQEPRNRAWHPKRAALMDQVANLIIIHESLISIETLCVPSRMVEFIVRTLGFWTCLLLLITVGLPVYCTTGYKMPFEAFCFIFFWISSIHLQRFVKSCKLLALHPRLQLFLAAILNPVLITSALGTAYFWIKMLMINSNMEDILTEFKRHSSWASIIIHLSKEGNFTEHVGAGDLATALLDAGIVSLGFKMFEFRRELLNSFITVISTSLIFGVMNLFLNVIFARAMGLTPAGALAFCARNVTIALGAPVVQRLDGSTTLMCALVIFGGMLYQMIGGSLFAWLHICDQRPPSIKSSAPSYGERLGSGKMEDSECRIIAAGVSVGINAAAMGTAQLIERDSRCTAYSALSMTIFGALTVALTTVPAVASLLSKLAGR